MKTLSWILVAGACAAACTHHRSASVLPAQLGYERVTLHLDDGTKVTARAQPAEGGVVWRADDGVLIGSEHVLAVDQTRRGRGALEGLGIGFAVGAALGVGMVYASGDDDAECSDPCFTRDQVAFISGAVYGLVGSGVGLLVGAVVGSRDRYELGSGDGAMSPRVSAQPLRGGAAGSLSWGF